MLRLRPFTILLGAMMRVRVRFGFIPNMEWFRAGLNRSVALDRAKAHIAIAELERCLLLRRDGLFGQCFGPLRR